MCALPFSGGPDYNVPRYKQAVPSPDPTDLPARLDGYGRMDNLGRIIVHDDFGQGLARWRLSQIGTGLTPALSTVQGSVFVPPNAVVFDATPAVNDVSYMRVMMQVRRADRFGFECIWNLSAKPLEIAQVLEYTISAGNSFDGALKLNPVTSKFQITDNVGDKDIADLDCANIGAQEYIGMKLVIDLTTGKYVRAVLGGNVVDLSAYSLRPLGVAEANRLVATMFVTKTHALLTVEKPYLGYATITLDEP